MTQVTQQSSAATIAQFGRYVIPNYRRFPVCLVFGHEVDGVRPEISSRCDTHVRIPMLGTKHSLNVATAGGVVIYELLRKYRALGQVTMDRA